MWAIPQDMLHRENKMTSDYNKDQDPMSELGHEIPTAAAMSNLWNDRRQSSFPRNTPNRRSGKDRRLNVSRVATSRRSTSLKFRLGKSGKLHALLLVCGDWVALSLSFFIAFLVSLFLVNEEGWKNFLWSTQSLSLLADLVRLIQFAAASGIAISVFWLLGHYSWRRPFWDEVHATTKLLLLFACLEATFIFAIGWRLPRIWLLGTWLVAIFLIPLVRQLIKHALAKLGLWSRPTAIIGIGRNARDTAAAISSEVGLGFYVSVFLVPPESWVKNSNPVKGGIPKQIVINGRDIPVRLLGEQPELALRVLGTPHLVVALESDDLWEVSKLLLSKHLPYSSLNIAPSIRGLPLVGMEMLHFFKHDVMLLRIQNNLGRKIPQRIKRAFDLVVATSMLIVLLPLFLFLIVAIRQSGSHVIFGHARLGKNGKPFKCYKFRTMVPDAEEVLSKLLASNVEASAEWTKNFKLKHDPRVTRVGYFLRKSSLDELPQLWNVLRGEMSLVGPRPIIEVELARYENKKDFFLEAKPGITGLWQISGRNDVSYAERVQLDAWYARNWHLWYDIVILLKTVKVVFGKKGAY